MSSPLLDIDMSNIVVDELHLMLRVTDILIRNLVWAMLLLDMKEKQSRRQPQYIDKLLHTIRSCGITFNV